MIGAIPIIAENRIREAMECGQFDNLKGAGQPLADLDMPYQPDWWIRKKILNERLAPDEVKIMVERLQAPE